MFPTGVKKPEVRIANTEKNQAKNMACCWVEVMVEKNSPMPSVVRRNIPARKNRSSGDPTNGI